MSILSLAKVVVTAPPIKKEQFSVHISEKSVVECFVKLPTFSLSNLWNGVCVKNFHYLSLSLLSVSRAV